MRKFLYYSLLCLLWISVVSCKDEEASTPPQPSFSVDKSVGVLGDTEFNFTVNQVGAQNISLLPYGVDNASLGGILIPASSFTNGVAIVKFKYGKIGTFSAVAVANNRSDDGTSVKNTYSAATTITIGNNKSEITDLTLGVMRSAPYNEKVFTSLTTKTTIDKDAHTILINVRYALAKDANNASYFTDLTKLVPVYANSTGSIITVGGTVLDTDKTIRTGIGQVPAIQTVDLSTPKDFVVKAADGTTTTYKVTVTKTPIQTINTIKSFSGVAGKKAAKERAMAGYVDNANKRVFIYDVYGTEPIQFDSMKVKYELDGEFAILKQNGKTFDATKAIFDLTPNKPFVVYSQDSLSVGGTSTYDVYAVAAPKVTDVKITSLNPEVTGTTEDFTIKLSVLTGTVLTSQNVTGTLLLPTGVTVQSLKFGGVTTVPITVGADTTFAALGVNLSGTPTCELTVEDASGFTYKVVYNISVTILK